MSMKVDDAVTQIFDKVPIFSSLSGHQLTKIKESSLCINLEKDETLFHSQQTADRFFVLRKGLVKLYHPAQGKGSEKIVEIIRPNQSFAIATMFMREKTHPVSSAALSPSRVYSFDSVIFQKILLGSPETCFRIMATMSQHLRSLVVDIRQLSQQCASSRLANFLLDAAPKSGTAAGKIQLETSKQAIASRLSLKPETLSRILHLLQKNALIEVNHNTIQIVNVDGLQAFAQTGPCSFDRG